MKLCVLFPGIGYTIDKPLLYYSREIVRNDYEIKAIVYHGDYKKAKSKKENLETFYRNAYQDVCEQCSSIDFTAYEDILFISKSIGTALAEKYAREHQLMVRSVLFTPLAYTFEGESSKAIAFHGTHDPWVDHEELMSLSFRHQVPMICIEGADHSLNTGDLDLDLIHLKQVMDDVKVFIENEKTSSK